jgi:GPH family glycoside/pentoside/hexuronide:cation symporter
VFANYLGKSWCKVAVMRLALTGAIVLNALLFFTPREAVLMALLLMMAGNFFHMMFIPMLFSTIPDTVDYGIRTRGKGAMAMFCAGHLFMLKLGLGFGGFFLGHFLGWFGYEPGAAQTDQALTGIRLAYAGSTVVVGAIALVCLQFYRLKRGWEDHYVPAPR